MGVWGREWGYGVGSRGIGLGVGGVRWEVGGMYKGVWGGECM